MSKKCIKKRHIFCLVALGVFLIGPAAAPAQAQQGLGERLGAQLDEGLDQLGNELREGWASIQQTVDRLGIQGRVYSRLRWDKHVSTERLDVEASERGIVVLRGQVPSQAAKQKAVQLARDTVGVERVEDKLSVAAPTTDAGQQQP